MFLCFYPPCFHSALLSGRIPYPQQGVRHYVLATGHYALVMAGLESFVMLPFSMRPHEFFAVCFPSRSTGRIQQISSPPSARRAKVLFVLVDKDGGKERWMRR